MTLTPAKGLTQQTIGGSDVWGATLNNTIGLVDTALGGTLSKAVTGTTTLTSTEAHNTGYHFTGTLSALTTVNFPAFYGLVVISNETNRTLSCGIVGGLYMDVASSITVAGWSDGTDFIALTSAATGPQGATGPTGPAGSTGSGSFTSLTANAAGEIVLAHQNISSTGCALSIGGPQGGTVLTSHGGWAGANYGKQLLITNEVAGQSNPTLALTDGDLINIWGVTNNSGHLRFSQLPSRSNNSTSPVWVLTLSAQRDVITSGSAAGAPSDTGKHLLIPFCSGTPTGVPVNAALGIAMRYDTAAHKLWCYDNVTNAWRGVALT